MRLLDLQHKRQTSTQRVFKMTAALSLILSGLLLAPAVNGQAYDAGERGEDAFEYVQPLNTTILGPYGHSPAVYPSREYLSEPYRKSVC